MRLIITNEIEETKILWVLWIIIVAFIVSSIGVIVLCIKKEKEKNVIREIADPFEDSKTEMYSNLQKDLQFL